MFERRLIIVLIVFVVAVTGLVGRLVQLQLANADYYRRQAEDSIILKPIELPFVRGAIRDRRGETLVEDQPCWDLTVDFGMIASEMEKEPAAIVREVKRWKKAGRFAKEMPVAEVQAVLRQEFAATWTDLTRFAEEFAPRKAYYLRDRAQDIYNHVVRIRSAVAEHRGFDAPVAEESQSHTLLAALGSQAQIVAREVLERYPWVHIEPSSTRRIGADTESAAHLLGRLGAVDADDFRTDPSADDPFAGYKMNERRGNSGVESAGEQTLRGRRGQLTLARDGTIIEEIPAEDGRDVVLSVDMTLQRRLYDLLGEAVRNHPDSSGGAIVVLDVATREVLALVSFPSYDPRRFDELFPQLRDDTERMPLRFRALSTRYAPGSTLKPLVCLSGLMSGKITVDSREECTGYLFPEQRESWRCWEIHGTNIRKAHGSINVTEALTGSCNIFMYRLGERLGVDKLCETFDMAGLGRGSGVGLAEDQEGINPTASWLKTHKRQPVTPGTARQFSIGQGEVAMTPIQVANLMAVYASGRYRPATLLQTRQSKPEWVLPATSEQLQAIREGIYGVVNDPEGTAYKYAHFEHDDWVLCGKTGSATAQPWPTAWTVPYRDTDGLLLEAVVREGSRSQAIKRFQSERPGVRVDLDGVKIHSRWPEHPPEVGEKYSHAWFGGYLQAADASNRPIWNQTPPVAFAILMEFGGSGGQTSGPLAKQVAAELLNILGPNLDAHKGRGPS